MEPKTRKARIQETQEIKEPEVKETPKPESRTQKDPHFDLRIAQYKARGLSESEYCLDCGWQYAKDPVAGVNICPVNKPDCTRNKTPISS